MTTALTTGLKTGSAYAHQASRGGMSGAPHYRVEIDGLRALAVLAVILHHFSASAFAGGYLGVDMFFVISGYVITLSLACRNDASLWQLASGFYARRIKRLTPALVVFVLITSVFICLFDPSPRASLRTGIAALFGIANLHLLQQATDYFGGSAHLNVFTHTWSLGVEDQFYLLFPLSIWFAGFGARGLARPKLLFHLTCACVALSLIGFIALNMIKPAAAFYLMPTRLWEIGAGVLAYFARHQGMSILPRWLAGFSRFHRFIPIVVILIFADPGLAIFATPAIVFLTALLIGQIAPAPLDDRVLTRRPMIFIGRISYSLYLYHWSVLAISRWTIGIHWWTAPFQLALMVLLAWLSYRHIEAPLRSKVWSRAHWKTVLYGLGSLTLMAGVLLSLEQHSKALYVGAIAQADQYGGQSLTGIYRLPQTKFIWQGEKCIIGNDADLSKAISIADCTLGDFARARRRVLVIGDSFSASFIQAFDALVRDDHFAVTLSASWGASPAPGIVNAGPYRRMNEHYWRDVVPALTAQLQAGDWVFVISDLETFSPHRNVRMDDQRRAQLEAGLASLSQQIKTQGLKLAILHGLPFARDAVCEPVSATAQWFNPFGPPCNFLSRSETLQRRAGLDEILMRLQARGALTLIDLMDVFCSGPVCTYHDKEGRLLYRDVHSHASIDAARFSAPLIRRAFAP